MSPKLTLDLAGGTAEPGDTVRGTVRVVEGGRSRTLDATLEFRESSEDYGTAPDVAASTRLHHGDLEAGASFAVELKLPDDAFPTFHSAHGSLDWYVRVRSDEWGPDAVVEQRVVVRTARERATP